MLNPAGLRRFPSPHSSLFFLDFWCNFRAQMRREGEGWILYRGLTPVARRGGDRPPVARGGGDRPLPRPWAGPPTGRPRGGGDSPLSPVGGATGPFFFQGPRCKFEKKNYTKGLSPYGRATGGYFWNISKRTYIFEIFIFLNIKKKKRPCAAAGWARRAHSHRDDVGPAHDFQGP